RWHRWNGYIKLAANLWEIIALHSGKCLDVRGGQGATDDGARVQQWDCNNQMNQKWREISIGNGYYEFMVQHSRKCLDVIGGETATENEVRLQQFDCNHQKNQHFREAPIGGGYFKIVAEHSNKVLDVRGESRNNGADVQQYEDLGRSQSNQIWWF